jgi:outer membrane biogenesis lipoprotein LolB
MRSQDGAPAYSNGQQQGMLIGSNLQFSGPPPLQQPQEQLQHQQQHQQHGGAAYRIGADGQRKYRGVSWVPEKSKWRAQLSVPGQKKMHLG